MELERERERKRDCGSDKEIVVAGYIIIDGSGWDSSTVVE
jgi:hypothetical protein